MNNVIVVPIHIKYGLWKIRIEEKSEELIAICPRCGKELNPNKIFNCCELDYLYCSDYCIEQEVKELPTDEEGYIKE